MASTPAKTTPVEPESNGDSDLEQSHRLTVDAILKAKDLKEEEITIPEWGGSVLIRSFTKKGQQEVRNLATVDDEIDASRLEMFIFLRGVIEPKFTDDQYEQLREKNAAVLDRVTTRIMSLSGMDTDSQRVADAKFRNGQ